MSISACIQQADTAYRWRQVVESGARKMVGVNE